MLSTAAVTLLLGASISGDALAQSSAYTHDGATTYCWLSPASYDTIAVPSSDGVVKGEGSACPVSLTVELLNVTTIRVGTPLPVRWTVKLEDSRLTSNALKLDKFYPATDNTTGTAIDIIHSRLYTCDYGLNCDPFQPGSGQVNSTSDQKANVSSTDMISFTSDNEIAFTEGGEFSVMAHIVMGAESSPGRTDYVVYTRVSIRSNGGGAATPLDVDASSYSGALSATAIAIIVVGAVAVIALVGVLLWFLRSEKQQQQESAPASFFTRVSTPQRDLDKTYDYFNVGGGEHVDGRDQQGPKMSVPKAAPYTQFPYNQRQISLSSSKHGSNGSATSMRLNRQSAEPPLFNRELSSQYAESTRSYLYENPAAAPPKPMPQQALKIYSTQNSVDFVYPDTDRSIDLVDASYSTNHFHCDDTLTDSTRSNDTDNFSGFLVESSRSSMMMSGRSTLMDSGATSMLESGVLDSNASMMISGRSTLMESGATSMLESGNTSMLESGAAMLMVSGQTTMLGSGRESMLDSGASMLISGRSSVVDEEDHTDSDLDVTFEFDEGIDTQALNTHQLRRLKVEI